MDNVKSELYIYPRYVDNHIPYVAVSKSIVNNKLLFKISANKIEAYYNYYIEYKHRIKDFFIKKAYDNQITSYRLLTNGEDELRIIISNNFVYDVTNNKLLLIKVVPLMNEIDELDYNVRIWINKDLFKKDRLPLYKAFLSSINRIYRRYFLKQNDDLNYRKYLIFPKSNEKMYQFVKPIDYGWKEKELIEDIFLKGIPYKYDELEINNLKKFIKL